MTIRRDKIMRKILLVSLLACLLFGAVLVGLRSKAFQLAFRSWLSLGPHSPTFPAWSSLPFPMPTSFYLFHVTNPREILRGAKPRLEEMGPFTFREQHRKQVLAWNSNDTVTYQQAKTWYFDPELSKGNLSSSITVLNPVAASVGALVSSLVPEALRPPIDLVLSTLGEQLFINTTVQDIMFTGVEDPLFEALEKLPFISKFFPPGSIQDRFGFLYGRNGSLYGDGVWNMYTGRGESEKMGQVHSWNFSSRSVYPGECGAVRGSPGEFFPPGRHKTYLELYSPDLCRALRFNFDEVLRAGGTELYQYRADSALFANSSSNRRNKCFEGGSPLPSGVFNASLCKFGAPLFISQPHFLGADPWYLSLLEGVAPPSEARHGSTLRLEPVTGVTAGVNVRMQVNMMLGPVPGLAMFANISHSFFPVMWSENAVEMPDDVAFKIKLLSNLEYIVGGLGWVLVGAAVSSLIVWALFRVTAREEGGPLLSQSILEDTVSDNVFFSQDEEPP